MSKNATIMAIILSLVVVGASIGVGGLLLHQSSHQDAPLIANVPPTPSNPPSVKETESDGSTTINLGNNNAGQDKDSSQNTDYNPPTTQEQPPVHEGKGESPKPSAPPSIPPPSSNSNQSVQASAGRYWVQAGSFSSLARASAAAEALQGLGLNGTIETLRQGERVLYRLRFGAWSNIGEAQRFRDYLRDQENLRLAFHERGLFDRSSDFVDAFVLQVS